MPEVVGERAFQDIGRVPNCSGVGGIWIKAKAKLEPEKSFRWSEREGGLELKYRGGWKSTWKSWKYRRKKRKWLRVG